VLYSSDPSFVPVLGQICRNEDVDLVFPLIDSDIQGLSRHAAHLEESCAKVVVVPTETSDIAGQVANLQVISRGWRADCGVLAAGRARRAGAPVSGFHQTAIR
jgi:hypothetical protein